MAGYKGGGVATTWLEAWLLPGWKRAYEPTTCPEAWRRGYDLAAEARIVCGARQR